MEKWVDVYYYFEFSILDKNIFWKNRPENTNEEIL
jgi:hypothetical protein